MNTHQSDTRIIVADDVRAVREKIGELLREQCPEWQIVGEASNGKEAVEKAVTLRPDVVLLDISMPRMNGLDAAKAIRQELPTCCIIFLSQMSDEGFIKAAMNLGADGYVVKARMYNDLMCPASLCRRFGPMS